MIANAIKRAVDGHHLDRDEMYQVFGDVMDGQTTDVRKSALLIAPRMISNELGGAE